MIVGIVVAVLAVVLLGVGGYALLRQRRSITRYERTGRRDRWTDVGIEPTGAYGPMTPKRYHGPFAGDTRKTDTHD